MLKPLRIMRAVRSCDQLNSFQLTGLVRTAVGIGKWYQK